MSPITVQDGKEPSEAGTQDAEASHNCQDEAGGKSTVPTSSPSTPEPTSSSQSSTQALLTATNLAVHAWMYERVKASDADRILASIHMQDIKDKLVELGLDALDCCIEGHHQGKSPMENWLASTCDGVFFEKHCFTSLKHSYEKEKAAGEDDAGVPTCGN